MEIVERISRISNRLSLDATTTIEAFETMVTVNTCSNFDKYIRV